jgi:hypothetical protein
MHELLDPGISKVIRDREPILARASGKLWEKRAMNAVDSL